MRNATCIGVLCLVSMTLAVGQGSDVGKSSKTPAKTASSARGVEEQITKREQDCAKLYVKDYMAAINECEADDIVSTDPGGRVTDKAQDKQDMSSGDIKFESAALSDIKVHVYGNAAVATGISNMKGTFKGQDISGTYRFTDTWVKRNGKWQMVATHSSKVQQ